MSRHGADPVTYEFLERKAEEIRRRLDPGEYKSMIDASMLNVVLADGDSSVYSGFVDGDPRTQITHILIQRLRSMSRRHPGVEKRKLLEQCALDYDRTGKQIHERIRQRLGKQVGERLGERLRAFRSELHAHDTPPSAHEVKTGADTVATALECPVCFEHAPAVACVPCGHVTCHACHKSWSSSNDACAVCRTRVERYIRLYM